MSIEKQLELERQSIIKEAEEYGFKFDPKNKRKSLLTFTHPKLKSEFLICPYFFGASSFSYENHIMEFWEERTNPKLCFLMFFERHPCFTEMFVADIPEPAYAYKKYFEEMIKLDEGSLTYNTELAQTAFQLYRCCVDPCSCFTRFNIKMNHDVGIKE